MNRLLLSFAPAAAGDRTVRQLSRTVALAALLLVSVTWRLWTPQQEFPQVPLFGWAANLPASLEWIGLATMSIGLCAALIRPPPGRAGRLGFVLFTVAAVVMVLVDQHRLQPWVYQLGIAGLVLAFVPNRRGLGLLAVLTVSIYFHSALSKIDHSFVQANGQQLVGAALQVVGLSQKYWSAETRRLMAAILPLGELLVAAALAVPGLRRWGLYGSLTMHGLLLLALGPWGMDHKPGVLIWNVYFMVQNWQLFAPHKQVKSPEAIAAGDDQTPRTMARWIDGLVVLAVLLPLLEPWGWFDHWPSWAVYAANPARVRLFVSAKHVPDLPESVQQHVEPAGPFDDWRRVRLDRWSLAALDVPLYPQDRFQLGAAIAVAERAGLKQDVRVVIEGRADRGTGERSRRELIGAKELLQEAERYWLNALPRR